LQLATLNHDVGEIQQVYLEWIEHALSGDDDLLGLFFNWKASDECSNLLGSFPLSELTETLLPSPDRSMDDLQEELACTRVEYENSSVNWLGRQVTLEGLVDRHSVDIGVIHKPNYLV